MKLVNTKTLQVQDFGATPVPAYAILSHTWGDDEVSYQDICDGTGVSKKGYEKVRQTCCRASKMGWDYVWIDTCCIDKSSSAELSESINSMYQWYGAAAVCLVWLEDVSEHDDIAHGLHHCRWISRGWTLQELIAPSEVEFFDQQWCHRGSKKTLRDVLSNLTRIPIAVLKAPSMTSGFSVAEKMSWASSRTTTRPEDIAYSLLGIFGVNMPLIYGEGQNAFRRLQEEIVKQINDLTILAWQNAPTVSLEPLDIFARSPQDFSHAKGTRRLPHEQASFSVTNKGLLMVGGASAPPISVIQAGASSLCYCLVLGQTRAGSYDRWKPIIIVLRKIGPITFCRDSRQTLGGVDGKSFKSLGSIYAPGDYYILGNSAAATTAGPLEYNIERHRVRCIHVPDELPNAHLTFKAPRDLWDEADRIFLQPTTYFAPSNELQAAQSLFFTVNFEGQVFEILTVCYYSIRPEDAGSIHCFMMPKRSGFQRESAILSSGRNVNRFLTWADLVVAIPEILSYGDTLDVEQNGAHYRIKLSFKEMSENPYGSRCTWSIPVFEVERLGILHNSRKY